MRFVKKKHIIGNDGSILFYSFLTRFDKKAFETV